MRGDVGECGLARAAAEGKGSAGGAWAEMARPCGDGACGAHCGQQLGVEHPHQERMVGNADAREELLEGAALGGRPRRCGGREPHQVEQHLLRRAGRAARRRAARLGRVADAEEELGELPLPQVARANVRQLEEGRRGVEGRAAQRVPPRRAPLRLERVEQPAQLVEPYLRLVVVRGTEDEHALAGLLELEQPVLDGEVHRRVQHDRPLLRLLLRARRRLPVPHQRLGGQHDEARVPRAHPVAALVERAG